MEGTGGEGKGGSGREREEEAGGEKEKGTRGKREEGKREADSITFCSSTSTNSVPPLYWTTHCSSGSSVLC